VTAKHYATKEIKNEFLKKEELLPILFNWNNNGFTTWVSLNDKEQDSIKGVVALQDVLIDKRQRPKGLMIVLLPAKNAGSPKNVR
jgi:hypothetical protein